MSSVVTPVRSGSDTGVKPSEANSSGNSTLEHATRRVERGKEMCFTVLAAPGESIGKSFARLAEDVGGATILNMLVFGATSASAAAIEVMQRTFGKMDWPLTWIEGGACDRNVI